MAYHPLPLPITTTLELLDFESSIVASIPRIFSRLGVRELFTILLAAASPSAAIRFLSASEASFSSL